MNIFSHPHHGYITRNLQLHSDKKWTFLTYYSFISDCVSMQMNSLPSLPLLPSTRRPLFMTPPPHSSCSESGLQFVPLPHTSLFKMTLLHFMVNQLFCLTQSAGSASQPARINWGAGWRSGGVFRERERENQRDREGEREVEKVKKKNTTNRTSC